MSEEPQAEIDRLPNGLTAAQDGAFARLGQAIEEHVSRPCDEPKPCMFHRALKGVDRG